MSWDQHHSRSERLAAEGEQAARSGDRALAEELYRQAGEAEAAALDDVDPEKPRTRGITAVSAIALWYKAHDLSRAEQLAHRCLAGGDLPEFAKSQIRELLSLIWTTTSAEARGVRFVPGDVLVSVKGGDVVYGGAPLDLIIRKVEGVQAVLLRTVEMLLGREFRRRGGPTADIQSMFKPWLFQAPAGSYQFAVRVQEPAQMDLWEADRPKIDRITGTFLQILHASATDPDVELQTLVPDKQYREAFLNLSRNLAPTGRTFERLDVRDAGAPAVVVASFEVETRRGLNAALRRARPPKTASSSEVAETIRGTLRALHLDLDWLEVAAADDPSRHLKIEEAGDVLDDVVGPMVNRIVNVSVLRRGKKLIYQDIELDE
jgi:hypothetical protein